jgi:hypothetical protein
MVTGANPRIVRREQEESTPGPLNDGELGVTPRNGRNCTVSPGPRAQVAFCLGLGIPGATSQRFAGWTKTKVFVQPWE